MKDSWIRHIIFLWSPPQWNHDKNYLNTSRQQYITHSMWTLNCVPCKYNDTVIFTLVKYEQILQVLNYHTHESSLKKLPDSKSITLPLKSIFLLLSLNQENDCEPEWTNSLWFQWFYYEDYISFCHEYDILSIASKCLQ